MASVSASIDPLYTHSAEGTVFRKYLQSTLCLTNSSLQNSNNAIHSIKKGFIYQRKSISSFKNQLSKREFLINTNESLSKDPVSKAFPRRSFIKSSLKLSSPTEQKLFITKKKKRRQRKFYRLLTLMHSRPHSNHVTKDSHETLAYHSTAA